VPFLRGAIPIVYCHHEKWDGGGYPRGLRGEEIPLGARIFSVVDAFDAMTFDRPYSTAIPFDAAYSEIKRCAGSHFDPAVVEAFLRVPEPLLEEIRRKSAGPA
jgi:HD-GYP domain-containing protein (c-di-GMP phosphodiesterase class II)